MDMKRTITSAALLIFTILLLNSCEKKDDYSTPQVTDYLKLEIGSYVRYRLDSTIWVNFGQKDTVLKYQAKDVVDAAITDNLGRPSYRIVRYISDTTGTDPWVPTATFLLTPTRESVELVENNLRFVKLKLPVLEGYNWKGNSYVSTQSADPNWEFRFMDDWDYTYENVNGPYTVWNNQIVENTLTVNQRDETIGFPNDPAAYSEFTTSQEVFGKNIGLIYRNFLHWEYQPPNGGNPGYKSGYGIRMVMIDHN